MKSIAHLPPNIQLFQGDVLEILAQMPEKSVDLIFADPPYTLSNGGFTCHAGKRVSVNKGEWDKSQGIDADFSFHYQWIQACHSVLKETGSIWISGTYHSIYMCGFALQKQGWHLINDICWFKPNAPPNLSCRMFTASHENLLWAKKNKQCKHVFNYDAMKNGQWTADFIKKPNKQMRSVWAMTAGKSQEKNHGKHPTQKPESLLERIILATSQEGDVVLDPFCGSGTTGVIALRQDRKFLGIDLNRDFLVNIAKPRLWDEYHKKVDNTA
jgi:site-specific DNA-methyltransferase (adenine-specific)